MLNIFTLTTNKLVDHLKSGQISSVEVCNQYIERIEKFEKDLVNRHCQFGNVDSKSNIRLSRSYLDQEL